MARYSLDLACAKYFPISFPVSTFIINVSGSFLIGLIYVFSEEKLVISPDMKLALMVGLLGGFTTFSGYALQTAKLLIDGHDLVSWIYFISSPIVCLAAVWSGLFLGRQI